MRADVKANVRPSRNHAFPQAITDLEHVEGDTQMSRILSFIRCAVGTHVLPIKIDPARSRYWCCGRCGELVQGALNA